VRADEIVVVMVTAPSAEVGERIAAAVVPEHLAACVNIVPGLRSIFVWQGKVEDEREVLLLMKTRADRLGALEARVRELHPYTVPEFIALPVVAGHRPYLAWVADSVTTKGGGSSDQE
jgi:periplasmic divalent cation tolerance protein